MPFVDVTAARILQELAESLDAAGVRFVIADDVGQVRDILGRAADVSAFGRFLHPTVQAAVDAVRP
jgi:sulfate permease, SulP family